MRKLIPHSQKVSSYAGLTSVFFLYYCPIRLYNDSVSRAASAFQSMLKGHLELECETNFHMPDFTFAFCPTEACLCTSFYFINSGISITSSGGMAL